MESVRSEMLRQMESLPDNPRIHRLQHGCFIIRHKDLGPSWSPEYHDWKYQYQVLSEAIQKRDFRSSCVLLVHVIRHRSVPLRRLGPSARGWAGRMVFHPEVRKMVKKLYLGRRA